MALLAVVAVVVIGLAVGVSPSNTAVSTSTTTPTPAVGQPAVGQPAASPGLTAARQSCSTFASLVNALQAGQIGPSQLATAVTSIVNSATNAAGLDRAAWSGLSTDATAFARAIGANDPTTSKAAQTLATDCQQALT
jgi:hypothetical protein